MEKLSYRKLVKLSTFRAGALAITSLIRGGSETGEGKGLAKDPEWGSQSWKKDSVSCPLTQDFFHSSICFHHSICSENFSDWLTSNKICPLITYPLNRHWVATMCSAYWTVTGKENVFSAAQIKCPQTEKIGSGITVVIDWFSHSRPLS